MDYKLEVDKLTKEIKQLKADKDFVWTLWKRLQLSTPDVADAMSLVAQREKEKNASSVTELKEEIRNKDEEIKEFSRLVKSQEKEIDMLTKSKEELMKRCQQLENQCSDLTDKASRLDRLLSKQDETNQRELVTAYEQERKELLLTISRLQTQITNLRDEKNNLKVENVEYQEKINHFDYLKETLSSFKTQVEDANSHITTQDETIRMLRDQLEQNFQLEKTHRAEDGYSSDRTEEYHSTKRRNASLTRSQSVADSDRPVTPIEDLNYKVDRLTLHMRHLQQCVANKENRLVTSVFRSRSMPPKRNIQGDNQKLESSRKIHFLSQKLTKTEALLAEEKKSCVSANEVLKKTNSRVQSMQLTIKQLRKQIEDNKSGDCEWKSIISRHENDAERLKVEMRTKEMDIARLHQNANSDAARIQDLLNILEKTRYELTENKIAFQQQDVDGENDRMKSVVRQLETEKSFLEMKVSCLQSELNNNKQRNESHFVSMNDTLNRGTKNKRVKILSKKPKRLATRKIKSMQSILNHFSGLSGDDVGEICNKEDDWEDDDVDEEEMMEDPEEEEDGEEEPATTARTSGSHVSSVSAGTKIARLGAHNNNRRRQTKASEHHVSRINDARDKCLEKDATECSACGQCRTLKNRIASLQQQLKAVTISRDACKSKFRNSTRQMKICHSDLIQAKARCDRLVESIKKQCARIQVLTEERRQLLGNHDYPISQENMWKEVGLDDVDITTIAKAHLDEITSQATMIRDLHQELSHRDVQLVQLREKVDRTERENSCKKKIIEDLRSKLQCFDGLKDRERTMADSKEKKCRDLEDNVCRLKTQLESLQTRFSVILNERKKFEFEASSLGMKLENAEKRAADIKQAKQILEIQLNKVDQEKDGKMVEIISRSDLALDKLSQQIQFYKIKCSKYENLIVNLTRHLADKSREIRRLIEFGHTTFKKLDSDRKNIDTHMPGYDFARSKAADILSLSTSEIDSLLNGDIRPHDSGRDKMKKQTNNSSSDSKLDLSNKCKAFLKKDSFEQDIQTMFVEELDKIVEIVAPLSSDSGCISPS